MIGLSPSVFLNRFPFSAPKRLPPPNRPLFVSRFLSFAKSLGDFTSSMDEHEFRRLLGLFPVVRSRDYCADSEKESISCQTQDEIVDWQNAWTEMDKGDALEETDNEERFWRKLRLAAEEKVGPAKAEIFCTAFQRVHRDLMDKLSLDAAQKFLGTGRN